MPAFVKNITISPNTPVESAITDELEVEGDYLTRIEVLFPPGCCCLVGFQLRYGEMPLFPSEPDAYVRGNGETVSYELVWSIPNRKCSLTLVVFNEDEAYEHTLYIRVYTRWHYEMMPYDLMTRAFNLLLTFLEHVIGLR